MNNPWSFSGYPNFQFRCHFGPEDLNDVGIIYFNPLLRELEGPEDPYRYIVQTGQRIVQTSLLQLSYSLDLKKTSQIMINDIFSGKEQPWFATGPQYRPFKPDTQKEEQWVDL